ncbi:STAS domain-containing protein [Streptomyces sp. NPDC059957]|uniref:STAS domain-containing protein n=1 Tax=unclassified Streptomyces TaxID=2593676 RepID=UPI00365A763C
MPPTSNIVVTQHADRTVVTLTGPLDMDTCARITDATDALALQGCTLTLDLSDVSFMDSSGLNMLLTLRNRAHAEGAVLELHGLPDQALRVLDITGARDLFTLHPATP